MFFLAIVNKLLRYCHPWFARQYAGVDLVSRIPNTLIALAGCNLRLRTFKFWIPTEVYYECANPETVVVGSGSPPPPRISENCRFPSEYWYGPHPWKITQLSSQHRAKGSTLSLLGKGLTFLRNTGTDPLSSL